MQTRDTRFPDDPRYVGHSGGEVIGPNRFAPEGIGPAPSFVDGKTGIVMVVLEDEHGLGREPIPLAYVLARCWGAKKKEAIGFRNGNAMDVRVANLFWDGFPVPEPKDEVEATPEPIDEIEVGDSVLWFDGATKHVAKVIGTTRQGRFQIVRESDGLACQVEPGDLTLRSKGEPSEDFTDETGELMPRVGEIAATN